MKNLKLILGLVVVMMTTIVVKGQEDFDLTELDANDFEIISIVQPEIDADINGRIYKSNNELWIEAGYGENSYFYKTIITFKTNNTVPYTYTDSISYEFLPWEGSIIEDYYEYINTDISIDENGQVVVEITLKGLQSHFGIQIKELKLVYDGNTKPLSIFEHEQTNTTVTSYNKELTIKSSEYQNVDVQIYNMSGQMVNTLTNIELGYSDTKINMYDNPNGVYFILVKDNYTGKVEKHKVGL